MEYKNVYKYRGFYTLVAKTQLMSEYETAMAKVHVRLSNEESLRLAQRHNLNSHFVHKVTHRDLVCLIYLCFPVLPFN